MPPSVSHALAGRISIDLEHDPLGTGSDGEPVYLRDLWPTPEEVRDVIASSIDAGMYETVRLTIQGRTCTMDVIEVADDVPVHALFETHLSVTDLGRSVYFYREVVGLPLALEVPERNAAFLWVGEPGCSMLGLWSLGSAPLGLTLHVAFGVDIDDLLEARNSCRPFARVALSAAPATRSW
jgi:hypothetical protein